MKENKFGFGEKVIDTPSLLIKKNIMTWDGTMIQLSNISCISSTNIATTAFPIYAVLAILAGFLLFGVSTVVALLLIAIGGIWIYSWYQENEKRKLGAILSIRMNSGNNLLFTFENKRFLQEVLTVLENIIIDGGESQVTINVKDCTISGNARMLTDLNI